MARKKEDVENRIDEQSKNSIDMPANDGIEAPTEVHPAGDALTAQAENEQEILDEMAMPADDAVDEDAEWMEEVARSSPEAAAAGPALSQSEIDELTMVDAEMDAEQQDPSIGTAENEDAADPGDGDAEIYRGTRGAQLRMARQRQQEQTEQAGTRRTAISQRVVRWKSVRQACNRKYIIRDVKIIGAESFSRKIGATTVSVPVAVCKIYGFPAYIPVSELFLRPPAIFEPRQQDTQRSYMDRALSYINTMAMGATLSVMIQEAFFDPDPQSERPFNIVCSRRQVILREIAASYQAPDDKTPRSAAPLQVGDVVTADVMHVYPSAVMINVAGIDITQPVFRLTTRPLNDATTYFMPGDKVQVRLTAMHWGDDAVSYHLLSNYDALKKQLDHLDENTEDYERIAGALKQDSIVVSPKISVSGTSVEAEALYADHGDLVKMRAVYPAIIQHVRVNTERNTVFWTLWLPTVDLPAIAYQVRTGPGRDASTYKFGDRVEFRPSAVNNHSFLVGSIGRILPSRG